MNRFSMWKEGVDGVFPAATPMVFEKGGSAPPPPKDNTLELEQIRNERADRLAREERIAKQQEEKRARQRAANALNSAVTGARQYGTSKIGTLGLAPGNDYGLLGAYESALNAARSRVPSDAENVSTYIDPESLWSTVSADVRNSQRANQRRQAQSIYGTGFDTNLIADTSDDAIIDAILGDQFTEASDQFERARARGQLNEGAMGYVQKELGNQRLIGRNKLQDTGRGILEGYRTGLRTRGENFNNRVNNWDFGDNIDFGGESSALGNLVADYMGRLEGDVRGATAGLDLFDEDALLAKAKQRGGNTNLGATADALVNAFATTEDDPLKRRVVGNTGVF